MYKLSKIMSIMALIATDLKRVPIGTFLTFWVPIGSLFSVFWLNSREECQLSLHVHNT